jgi:hypothetical protein
VIKFSILKKIARRRLYAEQMASSVLEPACDNGLVLGPGSRGSPQVTPKPAPVVAKQLETKPLTPEAIEQKIAEIDQKIKISQEAENEQTAQQLWVDLALLQKRTALLNELRTAYERWLRNLEKEAIAEKEKTALAKKLAILKERGVTGPPPYSLSFYDELPPSNNSLPNGGRDMP